ncbi:MAG: hypothetical protein JW995_03795 [Melioribacteraceae bacterium]|nr:hypothetical protein [Melioribacteraceae bacterium]
MKQLFHILKYKVKINSRIDLKLSVASFVKEFGSFLVYAGFAVGAFIFSKTALHILLENFRIGFFLLHQFLSVVFFIFFISINVGNIIVSWSTLYKSEEVIFFFSRPVHSYKVFLVKFLDNIFYSSSTLFLVLISVFLGYAVYFNLSVLQLIYIVVFNLLPFILTAASLGIIILLLIIKLASKIGARNLILTLALLYFGSVIIFFKSLSPLHLVYNVLAYYPNVDQYFGYLLPGISSYMPNQWFSDTLYWIVSGNFKLSAVNSLKQISVSIILLSLATYLGKLWYYETWLNQSRLTFRLSKKSKLSSNHLFNNSSRTTSVIIKDIMLFLRDSTQVLHAVVLLILLIIFMISSSGISYLHFEDIRLAGTIYLSIFAFNVLLVSTLSLRFIFPIISLEGMAFWKIKTAPIKNNPLLNTKLLPAAFLIILISAVLAFASHLKLAPHLIPHAVISLACISSGLIIMNFCMGIIFVRYREKNAIRIASSKGASLTFLFSVIYLAVIVGILYNPVQEHFYIVLNSAYYQYKYLKMAFYSVSLFSLLVGLSFYVLANISFQKDY